MTLQRKRADSVCMTDFDYVFGILQDLHEAQRAGHLVIKKITQTVEGDDLVIDIYFQPTKPIEYINLNFIAVNSNISFEEVINTSSSEIA